MSQVSAKLRRATGGYFHWCPACNEMHILPDGWTFDGNVESPTFNPSFMHSGVKKTFTDGKWDGFAKDAEGKPVPHVCHYILTAGVLNYCGDCTHDLKGQAIPLPDLPIGIADD